MCRDVSLKRLDGPNLDSVLGWPTSAASFLGVPPLRIEQPPVAQGLHSNEPLTCARILILDQTISLPNKPTVQ
jgi:hypothetical protein